MRKYSLSICATTEDASKQSTDKETEIAMDKIPETELVCTIEDILERQILKFGHLKDMSMAISLSIDLFKEVTE